MAYWTHNTIKGLQWSPKNSKKYGGTPKLWSLEGIQGTLGFPGPHLRKTDLDRFYIVGLLYLSGWNESGANKNNESEKAFVYVLRQNKDYVGRATCLSSNWLKHGISRIPI